MANCIVRTPINCRDRNYILEDSLPGRSPTTSTTCHVPTVLLLKKTTIIAVYLEVVSVGGFIMDQPATHAATMARPLPCDTFKNSEVRSDTIKTDARTMQSFAI
jgi:hypothetical protein